MRKVLENENVILLKADKRNSIILVNRHVYFDFGNKFLSNKTSFEPVLQNDNEYNFNSIKTFLAKLKSKKSYFKWILYQCITSNFQDSETIFLTKNS